MEKYNRLEIKNKYLKILRNGRRRMYCDVLCDCGTLKEGICYSNVKNGNTKSCGCLNKETQLQNFKDRKQYNKYDLIDKNNCFGYTNKNEIFYFDFDDYEKIKNFCWSVDSSNGYVIAKETKNKRIKLHRLVMDFPEFLLVDHIDRNKLNNRKSNLRLCTSSQNVKNCLESIRNTSGKKGVYKHINGKWKSAITNDGKNIFLGVYDSYEDAVNARITAENFYFGEFAPK